MKLLPDPRWLQRFRLAWRDTPARALACLEAGDYVEGPHWREGSGWQVRWGALGENAVPRGLSLWGDDSRGARAFARRARCLVGGERPEEQGCPGCGSCIGALCPQDCPMVPRRQRLPRLRRRLSEDAIERATGHVARALSKAGVVVDLPPTARNGAYIVTRQALRSAMGYPDEQGPTVSLVQERASVVLQSPLCGLPWPVCPDPACAGQPLTSSGGESRCGRCGSRWPRAEREPCPDDATVTMRDITGATARWCRAHAACAVARCAGPFTVIENSGAPLLTPEQLQAEADRLAWRQAVRPLVEIGKAVALGSLPMQRIAAGEVSHG